ncbi:MAG TPA: hypothetical protein VK211_25600 [Kamptonema sp.]|nr:hypothetical protein [Kamptonema sp.]
MPIGLSPDRASASCACNAADESAAISFDGYGNYSGSYVVAIA